MKNGDRQRMGANRAWWDEAVPHHLVADSYGVPLFLQGKSSLRPLEVREMGSVRNKTLLHLQCHFGLDTLSWARRGANVVGVDYSLPAIRAARRLAHQADIKATFLQSNVYALPKEFDRRFDCVYTAKGVLPWLPDMDRWAAVIGRTLKPGGRFFLLEDHPIAEVFANDGAATELKLAGSYFDGKSIREVSEGTYASAAKMRHRVTYGWNHSVSRILSALTAHGLDLDTVREYPYTFWRRFPFMREDSQGWWHLTTGEGMIPLMWSVRAHRRPDGEGSVPKGRPRPAASAAGG
jgi:SAM-dependent methyltransferase